MTTSAISAIDLALWDIKGKALGVPVYELLGGKSHDKIRMYANGWPRNGNTPEGIAEGVKRVVDEGYTALKFYPFGGEQVVVHTVGIPCVVGAECSGDYSAGYLSRGWDYRVEEDRSDGRDVLCDAGTAQFQWTAFDDCESALGSLYPQ